MNSVSISDEALPPQRTSTLDPDTGLRALHDLIWTAAKLGKSTLESN